MKHQSPTPTELTCMAQAIQAFIATHGRNALRRAIEQANAALTLPLTPRQQRRREEAEEFAKVFRQMERERAASSAAAEAEYQHELHVSKVRSQVYAEAGIGTTWIKSKTVAERWRGLTLIRAGLHKAIRAKLWSRGLARDDARFVLADATSMGVAIDMIMQWERKRLSNLSRRLDRFGQHSGQRPTSRYQQGRRGG